MKKLLKSYGLKCIFQHSSEYSNSDPHKFSPNTFTLFNINFNIIFISAHRYFKYSFPFRFYIKICYIFFILKAFQRVTFKYFEYKFVSLAVLVYRIEGVRHVSCQLEASRLLPDLRLLRSLRPDVQNKRKRCLGATGLPQSW